MPDAILEKAVAVIVTYTKLTTLYLCGNPLSDGTAMILLENLPSTLTTLSLSRTAVTDTTLQRLAEVAFSSSLRRVWLCGLPSVTDTGLHHLKDAVTSRPELDVICTGCSASPAAERLLKDALTSALHIHILKGRLYRRWASTALCKMAQDCLDLGQNPAAEVLYTQATSLTPDHPPALRGMAVAKERNGKPKAAAKWKAKYHAIAPRQKKYTGFAPSVG
eukprot:TRINITY_DN35358_c0_g1_i1.p1 TRINITY_DN35358_c0_g1~~TRINITY_DN35358_c0_g1_i1.p1  ORF type:complete len:238 (+),score=43.34 TRINITY_DN35358_c0_g1_i1:57-716(+)